MVKVISRGPVTVGNFSALKAFAPGKAIVLIGSNGSYRRLTPETAIGFFELTTLGIKEYLEFDVSIEVLKSVEKMPSADPAVAFNLEIEITARLEDPIAFIQKFGLETSILEPFYHNWLSDIRQEISRFGPDSFTHVQQTLGALQSGVASRSPMVHGVRVLGFAANVLNDSGHERTAIVARAAMLLRNYGVEAVVALKQAHPAYSDALEALLKDVREGRDDRARFTDEEWNRSVARVNHLVEVGIIDREERRAFLSLENLKGLAQLKDGKAIPLPPPLAETDRLLPPTVTPPSAKQDMPSKE